MHRTKFVNAVKTAQHDARAKCIFTAIVPSFNKVHTAKTPSELREWLMCYAVDVTVIIFTPALVTPTARADQIMLSERLKELCAA